MLLFAFLVKRAPFLLSTCPGAALGVKLELSLSPTLNPYMQATSQKASLPSVNQLLSKYPPEGSMQALPVC